MSASKIWGFLRVFVLVSDCNHDCSLSFKKFFFNIYLFLAVLGLCCGMRTLSSCSVRAPHCGGVSDCGAQVLGHEASVFAAHGLLSTHTSVAVVHWIRCLAACGIFPDWGSDLCPVQLAGGFLNHWTHQGSPVHRLLKDLSMLGEIPVFIWQYKLYLYSKYSSVVVGILLEKEMATPSSVLAWRIPWTEEPGGLQSIGSQRAGHN